MSDRANNEKGKLNPTRRTDSDHLGDDGSNFQILDSLELDEKDITWLQPKKLFFFHKKPINNSSNVFYGKQVLHDCCRDVAVKIIKFSDWAKKEIHFLKKARHSNIVPIYDAGEFYSIGHWIYIVMELCVKTLRQYVEELVGKPLDMKTFVSIFNQLLNGLENLHDVKILHRDIKPDNILVTESGEMKFSDFGISKQIESDRGEVTQTKYGAGADGYRPPESYVEIAKLTTAADIFSLAIVVVLLISNGRHPFGLNPYDWRDNIRDNRNLDLSIIPQHIPPSKRAQLTDLVADMLKSEPRERPSVKQIKSHDFFKDSPSTRVSDDKAAKSSHSKQMDADAHVKILDQKVTGADRRRSKKQQQPQNSQIKVKSMGLSPEQFLKKEGVQRFLEAAEHQIVVGDVDLAMQQLHDVLSEESLSAIYVKLLGDHLLGKRQNVRAMILYKIFHDFHKKEGRFSADDEVLWITNRIEDIQLTIMPLIEAHPIEMAPVISCGVKFIEEMLEGIKGMNSVTPDWKAASTAKCLRIIAELSHKSGDFRTSIRLGEEGLNIMEQHFGENASNYSTYGMLYEGLGDSYRNSAQYSDAEHSYNTAIGTYQRACDYERESEREDDIAFAMQSLNQMRRESSCQRYPDMGTRRRNLHPGYRIETSIDIQFGISMRRVITPNHELPHCNCHRNHHPHP